MIAGLRILLEDGQGFNTTLQSESNREGYFIY